MNTRVDRIGCFEVRNSLVLCWSHPICWILISLYDWFSWNIFNKFGRFLFTEIGVFYKRKGLSNVWYNWLTEKLLACSTTGQRLILRLISQRLIIRSPPILHKLRHRPPLPIRTHATPPKLRWAWSNFHIFSFILIPHPNQLSLLAQSIIKFSDPTSGKLWGYSTCTSIIFISIIWVVGCLWVVGLEHVAINFCFVIFIVILRIWCSKLSIFGIEVHVTVYLNRDIYFNQTAEFIKITIISHLTREQ